ncbi:hypothetical protein [Mycobacteroides abscessus]|uniref:hypothetical protein n=1 Tax=Mycobacteroides abscessus TaxID=36809 RepID=UPI0005E9A831|nr:hypothetical protein [Mycobacteroides abscessus]CPW66716.1 Uncharacterised protein [Mycobacteroides abscessus]SKF61937.1 Uncharacterised protein [Mycobacteroides abscessus subsp. bolletii]SKH89078.1 Uncharacterised protein [Mycobacteroides abscessus subsp. bolletii]
MNRPAIRVAATLAVSMLVAGCHQKAPEDAPYFPFPARHDASDTGPLGDNPLRAAAVAATAAATNDFGTNAPAKDPVTGGGTVRAVRAVGDFSTGVDVDLCVYDSPGLYKLDDTDPNRLVLTKRAGLIKMTVIRNPPPKPEDHLTYLPWHITNTRKQGEFSSAEFEQVCAQFKPEPFVQESPKPLAAFPRL